QAQMLMEGVTGAAGMLPVSDIRLKTNIEYMGEAHGRRWYTWDWVTGGSDHGIIAQENMDMVAGRINGFMAVDYRRL
ncbi:MAG: tail fiber domain-containing protein, partial [Deltaproteobacteria bacterium]|nr:tail fiber domain-containing protein [Deltaproteobacteria bacterium]